MGLAFSQHGLIVAVALWLAAVPAHAQPRKSPEMIPEAEASLIGRTAPDITGPLLDGGEFRLESLRGRPVIVSFWASWCTPCRVELPALSELQKRRNDIAIVAVNVDRDPAAARKFLGGLEVRLPVVLDPLAVAIGRYGAVSMPTTFVLDARGTVKHQKAGFNRETGIADLEKILAEVKR